MDEDNASDDDLDNEQMDEDLSDETNEASDESAYGEDLVLTPENDDDNDASMPTVLVLSEKGVGKRSSISGYRVTNRNGKGVKTINITEKTGKLVAIKAVKEDEDVMIINKSGVTIRLAVEDIKKSGRNTQGVKLIDIQKRNDVISSVCVVEHSDDSDSSENEEPTDVTNDVANHTSSIAGEGDERNSSDSSDKSQE